MSPAAPETRSSRSGAFHRVLTRLTALPAVRGGLLVAPDGLVIASSLPAGLAVEPISALAATLGRELELRASRLRRGTFVMAHFAATDGIVFVADTSVGFVVMLTGHEVNREAVRQALRTAAEELRQAWRS